MLSVRTDYFLKTKNCIVKKRGKYLAVSLNLVTFAAMNKKDKLVKRFYHA